MADTDWCDTDEGGEDVFTPMPTHCTRFECCNIYEWNRALGLYPSRIRLQPAPLVKNANGFMECTRCHTSYGRG